MADEKPPPPALQHIYTCEPGERIRGVVQFRNWLIVATDQRALRWNPDDNTIEIIGYLNWRTETDAEAVAAAIRKAPLF